MDPRLELKVGALAVPRWWRACGAFEARSFLAFLMKIPGKLGGLGQKEDLEAGWLDGTKKLGAQLETREVIKERSSEILRIPFKN